MKMMKQSGILCSVNPLVPPTGRKFGVLFYYFFFFFAAKIDNQEERIDSFMDILRMIVYVNVYNFECIYFQLYLFSINTNHCSVGIKFAN